MRLLLSRTMAHLGEKRVIERGTGAEIRAKVGSGLLIRKALQVWLVGIADEGAGGDELMML